MRKAERDRIKARRDRLAVQNAQLTARVAELENWIACNCYDLPGQAGVRAREILRGDSDDRNDK